MNDIRTGKVSKKTSKGFCKVTVKTKKPGQVQWAINKGRAVWYGGMDTGKDCSYTFKKMKYGNYLFRVKGDNKGATKKGWKAKTLKKY